MKTRSKRESAMIAGLSIKHQLNAELIVSQPKKRRSNTNKKKEQQKPEANSKKFTDEIHCNSPARVIAFTTNNSDSAQGRNPKNLNVQFHLHGLEPEEESDVEYDNNVGIDHQPNERKEKPQVTTASKFDDLTNRTNYSIPLPRIQQQLNELLQATSELSDHFATQKIPTEDSTGKTEIIEEQEQVRDPKAWTQIIDLEDIGDKIISSNNNLVNVLLKNYVQPPMNQNHTHQAVVIKSEIEVIDLSDDEHQQKPISVPNLENRQTASEGTSSNNLPIHQIQGVEPLDLSVSANSTTGSSVQQDCGIFSSDDNRNNLSDNNQSKMPSQNDSCPLEFASIGIPSSSTTATDAQQRQMQPNHLKMPTAPACSSQMGQHQQGSAMMISIQTPEMSNLQFQRAPAHCLQQPYIAWSPQPCHYNHVALTETNQLPALSPAFPFSPVMPYFLSSAQSKTPGYFQNWQSVPVSVIPRHQFYNPQYQLQSSLPCFDQNVSESGSINGADKASDTSKSATIASVSISSPPEKTPSSPVPMSKRRARNGQDLQKLQIIRQEFEQHKEKGTNKTYNKIEPPSSPI